MAGSEGASVESLPDVAPRRAVMLGASNLFRGITTARETACIAWGSPLELLVACGHGRSYGRENRVLGRVLPGILQAGLWNYLNQRPPAPTALLITDVGNDILYGVPVPQILDWVRQCLQRMHDTAEVIVITQLPQASIVGLTPWRFRLARQLLFPTSQLTLVDAQRHAAQLGNGLLQLADEFNATLVEPRADWYGIDPIHILRSRELYAWMTILKAWSDKEFTIASKATWREWLALKTARPLQRTWWGRHQHQPQPVRTYEDGSSIALF